MIVIGLIALLFVAERWMSARAAQRFERELARRGLDLNWRHIVPVEPRPEDNYFDALVVRAWLPPKGTAPVSRNGENAPPNPPLPSRWFQSPLVGLDELKYLPASDDERSLSALAKHFEKFEPGFEMLREASKRPSVYLPGDYSSPEGLPVLNYVAVRQVAQILATETRLHLLLGEPERAILDLDTIQAVMRALESKPRLLVSAMIRVAIGGLYIDVVRDGFRLHAWNANELVALRARLEKMDLVPIVMDSLTQGEMTTSCYFLKKMADDTPSERLRFLQYAGYDSGIRTRLLSFLPAGSFRSNLLLTADLYQDAPRAFASDGSRFYTKKMAKAAERINSEFGGIRLNNIFASIFVPNVAKAMTICAKNQELIRLGIIACALEEYRLRQGGYPESLEKIESAGSPPLPRDLITGGLPIYRRSGSTYDLYSPGEDEKDDGGSARDWVFTPGE